MADFCLLSRRLLNDDEHQLFRVYFLLGADWRLCARQFKLDRGNLFHAIYRIEKKLGRLFAQVEPYPLYPLDEYFGGTVRKGLPVQSFEGFPAKRNRLRVSLPLTA